MSVYDALMVLKRVSGAYREVCSPVLCEFSIPQIEFDIIMLLSSRSEFSTAKSICDTIQVKANVMSLHIEKLVNAGYIVRCPDENDRRKVNLRCTPKAKPIIERGQEIRAQFLAGICDNIPEEKLVEFSTTLALLGNNADKLANNAKHIH